MSAVIMIASPINIISAITYLDAVAIIKTNALAILCHINNINTRAIILTTANARQRWWWQADLAR